MTLLRRVDGHTTRWTVDGGALCLDLDAGHGNATTVSDDRGHSLTLRPRVTVAADGSWVELVCDGEPGVVPLLQAAGLAGLRAHHTWRDPVGAYVGDGFVECWLGTDLRVSVGVRILDAVVVAAGLSVVAPHDTVPTEHGLQWTAEHTVTPVSRDATAARALDWVRPRPPFYARWMSFVEQWSLDPDAHGLELAVDEWAPGFVYAAKPADLGLTAAGTLVVRHSDDLNDDDPAMPGRRDPTSGAWLVDLADGQEEVVVPAGPSQAVVLDIMGHGSGAVDMESDPPDTVTTLVSRAGGVDDPVVPVARRHDQPADTLIVATHRDPRRDLRLRVRPARGIHAAMQARDGQRRLTIHDDRDQRRPVATIDTSSGRLVDLRLPGGETAIADLPLHWLRYLGKSASHVADRVTAIDVVSWGPEQVALSLTSRTADGAASCTTRLAIPRGDDLLTVHVDTTLEGAAAWRTSTAEFVDVFPEWGIDPTRWRYRHVALIRADDTAIVDMRNPFPGLDDHLDFPVHALEAYQRRSHHPEYGPWRLLPGDALLLHGSDAGDVVITLGPVAPASLEQVATYCEHWGDVHLDVVREGQAPAPTEVARTEAALPDHVTTSYSIRVLPPTPGGLSAAIARAREKFHDPAARAS